MIKRTAMKRMTKAMLQSELCSRWKRRREMRKSRKGFATFQPYLHI
jgi:hypothetical protein